MTKSEIQHQVQNQTQHLHRHWLRNHLVELRVPGCLDLGVLDVASASSDVRLRLVVVSEELSDRQTRLIAVHHRHLAVHQDEAIQMPVLMKGLHFLESLLTVLGDVHDLFEAGFWQPDGAKCLFDDLLDAHQVERLVVDHKDASRRLSLFVEFDFVDRNVQRLLALIF